MNPIQFIDTHCHLDASEFDADRTSQRELARAGGVTMCVIPAVERGNWARVQEMAHRYGDHYALGIHPLYVDRAHDQDLSELQAQLQTHIQDPALVAVGEIGLDGFAGHPDMQRQLQFFRQQLALAQRHDLPVILHVRQAVDAVLRELRTCPVPGGIAHAFNGSMQQAQQFMDMGFALGFGGALTHERALKIRQLASTLPLSALVLETDAPDIPPHWIYKTAAQRASGQPQGRNSPSELPRIAAELARLRGIDVHELTTQCSANARRVLRWSQVRPQ